VANVKRANTSGLTKSGVAIADVPDMPTIGTATAVDSSSATVTYTAATTGGTATTFTATSTPGSLTGTGSSPITVAGLTASTGYTFTVRASNSTGNSPFSAASNSITTPALPVGFNSIATFTVGAGGSSFIEFTNIPQGYKHLQIRAILRSTRSANSDGPVFRLGNGSVDTGANYALHFLKTDGDAATSVGVSSISNLGLGDFPAANRTSGIFGAFVLDILDYQNTNKYKTTRALNGYDSNGAGDLRLISGLWQSTAAVNTIRFFPEIGPNFAQHSTFALYGIQGA
jgi:hypothetical protein